MCDIRVWFIHSSGTFSCKPFFFFFLVEKIIDEPNFFLFLLKKEFGSVCAPQSEDFYVVLSSWKDYD